MVDEDSARELNLLHQSPTFVIRQTPDGRSVILNPPVVPTDEHAYLVAGESLLPNGSRLPSVYLIEDGGGNLVKVFWRLDSCWFEPTEPEVPGRHGAERADLFPFDWEYAIPVENDVYHTGPQP